MNVTSAATSITRRRRLARLSAFLAMSVVVGCGHGALDDVRGVENGAATSSGAATGVVIVRIDSAGWGVFWSPNAREQSVLVRRPSVAPSSESTEKIIQRLTADEVAATNAWRSCWDRFRKPPALDEEAHDAYLETAERLENRLRQDPQHLGVLRDLIGAYVELLDHEAETPFAANLCRLASLRLGQFVAAAAPLDAPDRRRVAAWTSRLFTVMRCYPLANEALREAGNEPTARLLEEALRALGQRRFYEFDPFIVGTANVRAFGCLEKSPDPDLLWCDTAFAVSRRMHALPHEIVTYSLVSRGTNTGPRYYLYLYALNRGELLRAYGDKRPGFAELRQDVSAEIATYLISRPAIPPGEKK